MRRPGTLRQLKIRMEVIKMEPKVDEYTDSTCVASTGGIIDGTMTP
ncbi:MAG: hypothetical protein PVF58_05080 [Candidatus Methanofastidiosia archaeon]|jgi:hypothetical protein